MLATRTNPRPRTSGAGSPDARPAIAAAVMRDCLLRLRSAIANGRPVDTGDIDAVLSGDDEAQLLRIIGKAVLTKRQRDVLAFVWRYRREQGMSPTLQEIGDALGISKVTAMEHLGQLQRKGVVVREQHSNRSTLIIAE